MKASSKYKDGSPNIGQDDEIKDSEVEVTCTKHMRERNA
jgi:hypothetical protein